MFIPAKHFFFFCFIVDHLSDEGTSIEKKTRSHRESLPESFALPEREAPSPNSDFVPP
jgi:hypothetical protein